MRKERWTKLFGNKFSQNIHWTMLHDVEFTVKGKFLFLGEPRVKAEEREESEVIYDSEYVYAYIAKKIIEPLQPDFNQLQKIIANAWKVYKDSISES